MGNWILQIEAKSLTARDLNEAKIQIGNLLSKEFELISVEERKAEKKDETKSKFRNSDV